MPRLRRRARPTERFGIEVEIAGDSHSSEEFEYWGRSLRRAFANRPAARFYASQSYFHSQGESWDLKRDGSCGFEFVTPAMTWADWPIFEEMLGVLRHHGAEVDVTCGLHVHHDVLDYSPSQLRRLAMLWGAIEDYVRNRVVASWRRNSDYCLQFRSPWLPWPNFVYAVRNLRTYARSVTRRTTLNFLPFWVRGTVEFRLFEGTLDTAQIRNWVLFTQALTNVARRRVHTTTLGTIAGHDWTQSHARLYALLQRYGGQEHGDAVEALRALEHPGELTWDSPAHPDNIQRAWHLIGESAISNNPTRSLYATITPV